MKKVFCITQSISTRQVAIDGILIDIFDEYEKADRQITILRVNNTDPTLSYQLETWHVEQ